MRICVFSLEVFWEKCPTEFTGPPDWSVSALSSRDHHWTVVCVLVLLHQTARLTTAQQQIRNQGYPYPKQVCVYPINKLGGLSV